MVARLYLWLVCHNACPCSWERWLRLPTGGPLHELCERLERRYLWPDRDLSRSIAESRLAGSQIVDERAEDLRILASEDE